MRSLIRYCLEHREDYGHIDIVYGSRSPGGSVSLKRICLRTGRKSRIPGWR
ncbi:MAG: hypothetical protein V8R80_02555 [Eubacterium sp.]